MILDTITIHYNESGAIAAIEHDAPDSRHTTDMLVRAVQFAIDCERAEERGDTYPHLTNPSQDDT